MATKNSIFAVFGLRHVVLSPVGGSLRKLNTGAQLAQLQTFPYTTASKSFLYSNAYIAKSGAQTLTFNSVTNRQTNRQKLNVFGHPEAGEFRAPPYSAWWQRTSSTFLHLKLFGVRRIVLPLWGAENLVETESLYLKPSYLRNPLRKSIQILTVNAPETRQNSANFIKIAQGMHLYSEFY